MADISSTLPETDPNEVVKILKVSSSSDPQAVGTSIFKSIVNSQTYPDLRAIGHGAVGQMVKAVAISRGYLAERGIDLAVTIGFDTIENENGDPITAMRFRTFAR